MFFSKEDIFKLDELKNLLDVPRKSVCKYLLRMPAILFTQTRTTRSSTVTRFHGSKLATNLSYLGKYFKEYSLENQIKLNKPDFVEEANEVRKERRRRELLRHGLVLLQLMRHLLLFRRKQKRQLCEL